MPFDAEISFVFRLMKKYGVQTLRFPRTAPPQIDLGLRENIHLINLKSEFFTQMRHRTVYAIDDALLCHYNTLLLPESDDVLLIGPYLTQEITDQTLLQLIYTEHITVEQLTLSVCRKSETSHISQLSVHIPLYIFNIGTVQNF